MYVSTHTCAHVTWPEKRNWAKGGGGLRSHHDAIVRSFWDSDAEWERRVYSNVGDTLFIDNIGELNSTVVLGRAILQVLQKLPDGNCISLSLNHRENVLHQDWIPFSLLENTPKVYLKSTSMKMNRYLCLPDHLHTGTFGVDGTYRWALGTGCYQPIP